MLTVLSFVELAIVSNPSDAKTRHAGAVDGALPTGELLDAQRIYLASLVDGQKPAGNRGDDLGLSSDDPSRG